MSRQHLGSHEAGILGFGQGLPRHLWQLRSSSVIPNPVFLYTCIYIHCMRVYTYIYMYLYIVCVLQTKMELSVCMFTCGLCWLAPGRRSGHLSVAQLRFSGNRELPIFARVRESFARKESTSVPVMCNRCLLQALSRTEYKSAVASPLREQFSQCKMHIVISALRRTKLVKETRCFWSISQ